MCDHGQEIPIAHNLRHARHALDAGRIDGINARPWLRWTHNTGMQHSGKCTILDVCLAACNLGWNIYPLESVPDVVPLRRRAEAAGRLRRHMQQRIGYQLSVTMSATIRCAHLPCVDAQLAFWKA